jgi:hypothetical protein
MSVSLVKIQSLRNIGVILMKKFYKKMYVGGKTLAIAYQRFNTLARVNFYLTLLYTTTGKTVLNLVEIQSLRNIGVILMK